LRRANLEEATIHSADWRNANLEEAIINGADLSTTLLEGATINEATQLDAKWHLVWEIVNQGAEGRDLTDADLSRADLTMVNLQRARLVRANLRHSKLLSANFIDADLSSASVKNALFGNNSGISEETKLDLIRRGAIFEDSPD
jgi:uncharacterized protein YjbI with pentapeptide repeats